MPLTFIDRNTCLYSWCLENLMRPNIWFRKKGAHFQHHWNTTSTKTNSWGHNSAGKTIRTTPVNKENLLQAYFFVCFCDKYLPPSHQLFIYLFPSIHIILLSHHICVWSRAVQIWKFIVKIRRFKLDLWRCYITLSVGVIWCITQCRWINATKIGECLSFDKTNTERFRIHNDWANFGRQQKQVYATSGVSV